MAVVNLLIAASCMLVFYKIASLIRAHKLQRDHGCRSPPHYWHRDPILGLDIVIGTMVNIRKSTNLPTLAERFKVYGPTYQTSSVGTTTIWSKDPKLIQHVWGTSSHWGVAPNRLEALEPFLGRGFFTVDGEQWEQSRALMRPSFHKSKISDLTFFTAATEAMLNKIPRDSSTIDMQPLLFALFLDTGARFLLNQSMGAMIGEQPQGVPIDSKTFLDEFHNAQRGGSFRVFLGKLRVLLPRKNWDASCAAVHGYVNYLIDQAQRYESKNTSSSTHHQSLLYDLVQQTENKEKIRNHVIQGMLAAQDTTSLVTANAIFLLSRNPAIWSRVREEAQSLAETEITFDGLRSSKLLQNILYETLRLYPVLPANTRTALCDTMLPVGGGSEGKDPIFVPEGTKFNAIMYCLHRDPEIFGRDLEAFNPDRWDTIKPGPFEYMAFGQGRRICLGQQKAMAEASYILVRMALSFKLESRDSRPYAAAQRLTTGNAHGCRIAVASV